MVIYIGNISVEASEQELSELFEQYGQVTSVHIMRDEVSGGALGFAFVEMPADSEASGAIEGLNGTRIAGRIVMACEAPQRIERRHPTKRASAPKRRK
jgi:RNA recognition motif-containing protein